MPRDPMVNAARLVFIPSSGAMVTSQPRIQLTEAATDSAPRASHGKAQAWPSRAPGVLGSRGFVATSLV